MANISVNTDNIVTRYSSRVIARMEELRVFQPLIGKKGDKNSFIYIPPDEYKDNSGKYCNVPLLKGSTASALEDGATYENAGTAVILSTSQIVANERGQVWQGPTHYERIQSVVDFREEITNDAASWFAADFDKNIITKISKNPSSFTSQNNVYYCGGVDSWADLDQSCGITPEDISKAKRYFAKRGIRPGLVGPNKYGYILILPSEAIVDLKYKEKYWDALISALPRSEDNTIFKGSALNPFGYWDGVYLVEDLRPVYGGETGTFLITEEVSESGILKYEGLFLGAQGIAYAEWLPITWYERIYDHNRKFEISVRSIYGVVKTAINLGTLNSESKRDYGIGYFCGTAPLLA